MVLQGTIVPPARNTNFGKMECVYLIKFNHRKSVLPTDKQKSGQLHALVVGAMYLSVCARHQGGVV